MKKPKQNLLGHGVAQMLYEEHLENEPGYHKLLARVLYEIADATPVDEARYRIPAVRGLLDGSFEWLEPIFAPPASELDSRLRYLEQVLQELRKHVLPILQQEEDDEVS